MPLSVFASDLFSVAAVRIAPRRAPKLWSPFNETIAAKVIADYARNVRATYGDAVNEARAMQTAIDAYVNGPSVDTLRAAKEAWIRARDPYGQSEAFRFYDGPIDNSNDGPEGRINGWPLDEFTIDYTRDTPRSGLINDLTFTDLGKEQIADENEKTGEKAITSGWHAIEFSLGPRRCDAWHR